MHPDAIIHNVDQGTDEWYQARNGLITASEMSLVLTPTLKVANNDKTRKHVYELAAQRISGYTEPSYVGEAMLRGHIDEVRARDAYSENYEPVYELGFITRDIEDGCVVGYSPDGAGVMGSFGIECKSRIQKYQIETITSNDIPTEHIMQIQTGLMVTGWDYIDYVSYSGGLPMWVIKANPIKEYQDAIKEAALSFDLKVKQVMHEYYDRLSSASVLIETEREEPEMEVYFGDE